MCVVVEQCNIILIDTISTGMSFASKLSKADQAGFRLFKSIMVGSGIVSFSDGLFRD